MTNNIHASYALPYAGTGASSLLPLKKELNVGDKIFLKHDIRNIKEWMENVMFKSVLKKLQ
jgi:hypothetical protein